MPSAKPMLAMTSRANTRPATPAPGRPGEADAGALRLEGEDVVNRPQAAVGVADATSGSVDLDSGGRGHPGVVVRGIIAAGPPRLRLIEVVVGPDQVPLQGHAGLDVVGAQQVRRH